MFRLEPRPAASPPWSYGSPPLGRGQGRCRMFRLEPRPAASRLWSYGSPLLALALTVLIGTALFIALGKDPVRGLQLFFWAPLQSRQAPPAAADRARAGPVLSRQRLEHRRRGAVRDRRRRRRRRGAAGQPAHGRLDLAGHLARRRAGRHGLGGAGGPVARPVPCERNPGQPDAGLRGRAGAGLSGLWPLERPAG